MPSIFMLACLLLISAFNGAAQGPPKSLHGVDFSPYLPGQDPNHNSQITRTQIHARMQVMAPHTNWVRSFGSANGLENTPSVARQLGLKMAAGAWIGSNTATNQLEINNLIAAANAGQVDIAIVGSEVLLRNDVSEATLISYMNQVRQAIPVSIPVTTADVYGTLIAHPNVIAASDVVFANFYPYWEGVSIDNAVCAIARQYQSLVNVVGAKQVIISESGWPSGGNAVGAAIPSPSNAAKFFLQFVSWAKANSIPYFYFAGFDEAWKTAYEGPQGAHWGIWDESATPKPGMSEVLDGKTTPVSCDGTVCGPGTPEVKLTYVPPYGSGDRLEGAVCHVSPAAHSIAIYIRVAGGWWTKPSFAQPVTIIQTDGTWSAAIVTGGSDYLASDIAAFLIPSSFYPPPMSGGPTLPDVLTTNSVARTQFQRTQNSISGVVLNNANHPVANAGINGGALGATITAPSGKYSFANLPASGTVVLTPGYPNHSFVPATKSVIISNGNQLVNFVATPDVDRSVSLSLTPASVPVGSSFTATLVVSNAGIAEASGVLATATFPQSLSVSAVSATRGQCTIAANQVSCNVGALLPTASSIVSISAVAAAVGQFDVLASVTGPGADVNPVNNNASQRLTVLPNPPVLLITKSHNGAFTQGQKNGTYTVVVSNAAAAGPATGTIVVTEIPPSGLTLVAMNGPGWSCGGNTCSRSGALAPSLSYPPITVTVDVLANAASPQVNAVSVSGGGSVTANATDSTIINPGGLPFTFSLNPTPLAFGAKSGGPFLTPSQEVTLTMSGGTSNWTAASDSPWLGVTNGAGIGSGKFTVSIVSSTLPPPGTYAGKITVNVPGASNGPIPVTCTLTVKSATSAPFGSFDTPPDIATGISGSIAVTGWVLDDIAVKQVTIWRDPVGPEPVRPNGYVYIGDAIFVAGARPDVERSFPSAPFAYRAGWGYMMLTYGLPAQGNGTYRIHALAVDEEGNQVKLGTKTITVDNAHSVKPFGAIDTPAPGETVSGTVTVSGWALTPPPCGIATDGSTISVYVNGADRGHPTYSQSRPDVASLFPGYINRNFAGGTYSLNSMLHANGLSTLAWVVTDNCGHVDGMGSRYFNILNATSAATANPAPPIDQNLQLRTARLRRPTAPATSYPAFRHGYDWTATLTPIRHAGDALLEPIELKELDRLELHLPAGPQWSAALRFNDELRDLPIGSTFDPEGAIFYWQLGPGFLGEFILEFRAEDGTVLSIPVRVGTPTAPADAP